MVSDMVRAAVKVSCIYSTSTPAGATCPIAIASRSMHASRGCMSFAVQIKFLEVPSLLSSITVLGEMINDRDCYYKLRIYMANDKNISIFVSYL